MAERRKNDCIENKLSRGLHVRLGASYTGVALGRIRCFCLSQAARDVQQVQVATNSPLCARMGYKLPTICCMLREEGLIVSRMGIHKLLQKHRETINIKRRPGSGQRRWRRLWKHSLSSRGRRTMKRPRFSCTLYFYAMATPWPSSGGALLWAGHSEAVPIASWFASKIKWSVSSGHRNMSAMASITWYGQTRRGRKGAATGHESFYIVIFSDESFCDHYRTVHPFRLNGCFIQRKRSFRFVS